MLNEYDLKPLVRPLLSWFQENARELPWRSDPRPYYVWISEIMLQQTRVEAVKRYFTRFISELPDVKALAECPEDVYLKLWEGLGYYSRVRNLNAAAQQIMTEFQGVIPEDYETLLTLKGIGHYTAGAISSLAYQHPVPAVDGNVLRILTRVSGDNTDIMKQSFRSLVEDTLRSLLEGCTQEDASFEPRLFNQALMELGALVCVPNGEPHCPDCPWKELCAARKEERWAELPVKTKAKARRVEKRTILLIRDGNKVAIHKRENRGLLAGLYEFPNQLGHFTQDEAIQYVRSMGFNPLRIKRLEDSRHIFSHVEWQMIAYHLLVEEEAFAAVEEKRRRADEKLLFVDRKEQQERYAVPSAFAAYKDAL